MASIVYPDYNRVITVYDSDATTLRTIGPASDGNITTFCANARFTLSAEKGCASAELTLKACDTLGVVSAGEDFLLEIADVVTFAPQAGADAWYMGTVTSRTRSTSSLHTYRLDGLAVRLTGLPPVDDGTTAYFGAAVQTGDDFYPTLWYVVNNTNGIVNWLANGVIDDADLGIDIAGSDFENDSPPQYYTNPAKIQNFMMDFQGDCSLILSDLARMCPDLNAAHIPPWPCIWGVKPDRTMYFRFLPNTEIGTIDEEIWWTTPAVQGRPTLRLGGVPMTYQTWERTEADEFYNVLVLTGGVLSDGTILEKMYQDADSIAAYKRYRIDRQTVPWLGNTQDAQHYANGYFARFAQPTATHSIQGFQVTSATTLPLPWDGYWTATDKAGTDERLTLLSVEVDFNETPIASLNFGDIERSLFAPTSGNARAAGSAWHATQNRIPQSRTPKGYGDNSTALEAYNMPRHSHQLDTDGGPLSGFDGT